jgi:hypothetical protein
MTIRDTLERLFWTFVATFLGSLLGAPALLQVLEWTSGEAINIDALAATLIAAAIAGLAAAANVLLIFARYRLSVLPNPGDGLPGLPTGDAGQVNLGLVLVFVIGFILGALCYANGILVGN